MPRDKPSLRKTRGGRIAKLGRLNENTKPLLNAFSKGLESILDKSKEDLEAPTPKEALRYFT
jgi:hypothetical protein